MSFDHNTMHFDTEEYDYDIVFEEFLTGVEAKYTTVIQPNNPKVVILVRIQSALEIISNILDQIELLIKETFKISFTLSTIKNAISMINKELLMIFKEVKDFFNTMKEVEMVNGRAFEMVVMLSKQITKYEKLKFLIPKYEKDALKESIKTEIPLLKQYLMSELLEEDDPLMKEMVSNDIFGTSVMQVLKLNDVFQFFNRLRSLHCEFSFLLLHIYFRDNCPKTDRPSGQKNVKIPDSHYEDLFQRCVELGEMIFVKVNICRRNYCSVYQKRTALIDNYRKKQELQIQQLNNLQIILRIITELNNKHDALVGQLLKTTKLYDNVHSILEKPWKILKIEAGTLPTTTDDKVKPSIRNRSSLITLGSLKSMIE